MHTYHMTYIMYAYGSTRDVVYGSTTRVWILRARTRVYTTVRTGGGERPFPAPGAAKERGCERTRVLASS